MPRVKFGSFELDPFTGELWHGNVHTHLQEQPLQVLICLLERQGKVVTREQLRERVWGNAIHVNYEDGLNTAVSKLRQALEENADHPVLIETLPRKGYRFTARAVEEASGQMPALRALTGLRSGPEGELVQVAPSAPPATGPPTDPRPRFRAAALRRPGWVSGLLGLGLLTSGLGAWFWLRRGPTAVPPVVAVLPVEGKGAEGAGEGVLQVALQSLHAELGRSRGVRLISMGSARRAREEGLPLQAFARRLQADSVLEAAMQPAAGGQMVFTVNWVDGATGRVLGSDRLQGPASEGAELGLQMSRRVARRLNLELAPAPRTPLPSEEVRTYLLAGQRAFEQGGAEGLRRAEELYRKAIVLDPGSSEAHAGLSELLQSRCFGPWDSLDPLLVAPEAEREARRAVEGDPGSARAHLLLGECLLYFRGDAREGEREITKGIALAPGSPAALQSQAWLDLIHRRWEPAVGGFEQALSLNPLSCFAFDDLCRAQFYAGRDAETL
ncbi:MAG TPA: winged helix-turn-helix domain-containing protein, partial [Holophagaceae bacterium]|nr:winged helix-turn-helix domain-containing protein [Holophagaceae bacterium]